MTPWTIYRCPSCGDERYLMIDVTAKDWPRCERWVGRQSTQINFLPARCNALMKPKS